jgi:SAM-dependent methyltransferase
VGCGTGWLLAALASRGVAADRLHGVELRPERVLAARAAVPGARIGEADARRLPFPSASFHLVTLLTVLSSAGAPSAAIEILREARRVLAPGGVVVCWEPRWPNPRNPGTRRVTARDYEHGLGEGFAREPITLLPAIARHLGPATDRAYGALARAPVLRSHVLVTWRREDG